jgi:hypothetical protein
VFDTNLRASMSRRAVEEGATGRSWARAMEAMVVCYREGIAVARERERRREEGEEGERVGWGDVVRASRMRVRVTRQVGVVVLLVLLVLLGLVYWVFVRSG